MVKVGTLTLEVVKVEVQDDAAVKKMWEKVKEASVKVELREGQDVEKRKTKMAPRKNTSGNGYECVYGDVFEFDIGPDYPGELRLNLCRSKNTSAASGTKVLANAGIFVKNLVKYIEKQQTAIFKSFSLFSKEKGLTCGSVLLKVNYKPVHATEAYAMPAVPKESGKAASAAPAPSQAEEAELEDHAVQDVDESKDKVHFAAAVNAAPPLVPIAAAAAVLVVGLLGMLLSGGGGKKAAPPAPPAAKGKGKK